VCARELGTNIQRTKILKNIHDDKSNRRKLKSDSNQNQQPESIDSPKLPTADICTPSNEAELYFPSVDDGHKEITNDISTECDSPTIIQDVPVVESIEQSVPTCEPSEISQKVTSSKAKDMILSPNELVYTGAKTYSSLFCFWQVSSSTASSRNVVRNYLCFNFSIVNGMV